MTDLTYSDDGLFTRFYPETTDGHFVWNEMVLQEVGAAVLSIHAKNVIAQIRKAGYSVSKAKPCDLSIDEILMELEA